MEDSSYFSELKKLLLQRKFSTTLTRIQEVQKQLGEKNEELQKEGKISVISEELRLITLKIFCHLRSKEFDKVQEEFHKLGFVDSSRFLPQYNGFEEPINDLYSLRDTVVPFSLLFLNSFFPFLNGMHLTALDRLYSLLKLCEDNYEKLKSKIDLPERELQDLDVIWASRLKRVACTIAEIYTLKDHPQEAIWLLQERVLNRLGKCIPILSLMGRICLRMGAVESAEEYFSYAECLNVNDSITIRTNNGLLALANCDMEGALSDFQAAYKMAISEKTSRDSINQVSFSKFNKSNENLQLPASSLALCANNLAVACLYAKKLKDATSTIESSLNLDLENSLFVTGLRNLVTLYEFSRQKGDYINHLKDLVSNNLTEDQEILSSIVSFP